jgi:cobalamin synthase
MSWITELLFNAGSGGLFGMIGSLTTTWMRLKEKRLDNEHQLALAEKAAQSAEAAASWGAFAASQTASSADMTEKVSPWAANVRAVTRPFLTAALVLAAFVAALFAPQEAKASALQNVQMLAGTAVAWWFGSRMTTQIGGKR